MTFAEKEQLRILFLGTRIDTQMTKSIQDIAKPLGIALHDHIIVGKDGYASLKGLRLI
jgi:DNA repair protein RadC